MIKNKIENTVSLLQKHEDYICSYLFKKLVTRADC